MDYNLQRDAMQEMVTVFQQNMPSENSIITAIKDTLSWSLPDRSVTLVAALKLTPFPDGNMWCYLYGEDLQNGVAGFGETVSKAAANFYEEFTNRKLVAPTTDHRE